MTNVLAARRAGVLLHPTSLPGAGPNGTIGAEAWRFVDWLAAGGFSVWQTLPIGPVDAYGSPYCQRSRLRGLSRVCSTPRISSSLRELPRGARLRRGRASRATTPIARSRAPRTASIWRAFATLRAARAAAGSCRTGCSSSAARASRARRGGSGRQPFRDRSRADAAARSSPRSKSAFRAIVFEQYLFDLEWTALKRYANDRGVYLFGDLPFYVDRNSVEVWWHRELFALDANGRPRDVAGVPPDYFNEDGQLWGNPLYDWDAMQRRGFRWWLARIEAAARAFRSRPDRPLPRARVVLGGAGRREDGARRRVAQGPRRRALDRAAREARRAAARRRGSRHHHGRRPRVARPVRVCPAWPSRSSRSTAQRTIRTCRERTCRTSVAYTGTHDNDTTVGWYAGLSDAAREGVLRHARTYPGRRACPSS